MDSPNRTISDHVVAGDSANTQLVITVLDEPGQGGASHLYSITGLDSTSNTSDPFVKRYGKGADHSTILFQNGPIKEFGVNGITHEALLAILIDRLKGFQSGPYKNQDNSYAQYHLEQALAFLQNRTRERIARGVEGTHTV
jgi:hypothetical protein